MCDVTSIDAARRELIEQAHAFAAQRLLLHRRNRTFRPGEPLEYLLLDGKLVPVWTLNARLNPCAGLTPLQECVNT